MSEITYLTREGYDKLKKKLDDLKGKGRSEMAAAIQEAREKGDLSENAEYDAAKDRQGLLEMEISKLENVFAGARVLDTANLDKEKVYLLSTVRVKNLNNGREMQYTIVAEQEADFKAGKISMKSPVGSALLGKRLGEIAEAAVPTGVVRFEVLEISL
jgi:transcription elongation factor GreA